MKYQPDKKLINKLKLHLGDYLGTSKSSRQLGISTRINQSYQIIFFSKHL
ncbi:hypothetical protein MNBD_ALPHA11-1184 [hydrothermal vent metagenome]|uniref:Uncharacterized protein n=1 Tax=hydrothermal vent metagenome TaxID=652676 RepID=A0A3B0TXC5_9ZZZZ